MRSKIVLIKLITRYFPFSICSLFIFKFFLQLLCISLVQLIFRQPELFCSKIPYSYGRMLASKIAYSARNSAGSLRLKALEFAAFVIRVWENTT